VLEAIKNDHPGKSVAKQQIIAKSMARSAAVKRGKPLKKEEMESIYQKLFACKMPEISPNGKPTLFVLSFDELLKKFKP